MSTQVESPRRRAAKPMAATAPAQPPPYQGAGFPEEGPAPAQDGPQGAPPGEGLPGAPPAQAAPPSPRQGPAKDRPRGRLGQAGSPQRCGNRHCERPILPAGVLVFALERDFPPYRAGLCLCCACASTLHPDTKQRVDAHLAQLRQNHSEAAVNRVRFGQPDAGQMGAGRSR